MTTRRREPKNPKSCHERALGLLAVRPRTRRELERRLLQARFEAGEVHDVLDRLELVGLIDDEAFARQYAEHRFEVRHEGRRAVANGLRAAGVSAELAVAVSGAAPEAEDERAEALARSRANRFSGVEPQRAFARLTSLLMRRGFAPDVARAAARKALELPFQDDERPCVSPAAAVASGETRGIDLPDPSDNDRRASVTEFDTDPTANDLARTRSRGRLH